MNSPRCPTSDKRLLAAQTAQTASDTASMVECEFALSGSASAGRRPSRGRRGGSGSSSRTAFWRTAFRCGGNRPCGGKGHRNCRVRKGRESARRAYEEGRDPAERHCEGVGRERDRVAKIRHLQSEGVPETYRADLWNRKFV
jgi:hypothetical protein